MQVTNHGKIEFGETGYIHNQNKETINNSTRDISPNIANLIKITQQGVDQKPSSGHKQVNYLEQKSKMIYREINKKLGVN